MKNSSPIIAGIDFSASSAQVIRHAIHASGASGVLVIALHVIDASRLNHRSESNIESQSVVNLEEEAQSKLAAWISAQTSASNLQNEIRRGRPAEELLRAVEEHRASMLVIAANDTTKNRLGTIAARCVRTVPCNVMILRNWQSGDFKKIVICTDFSATSGRALSLAVSLAAEQGAELEIVHVMYPPERDIWGEALEHNEHPSLSFAGQCRARANELMVKFIEPHRGILAGIIHRQIVLESVVPSVAITHHIEDTGADLVVIGTRGQSRFMSYFIGTNAERLMNDLPVCVLAVRSPEELG